MDLLNFLPPEMVEEIFSKLSVDDLKTFRLVSNYYEILARRSLLKFALISIGYRNKRKILNLDTSNISHFLSSFLIESASVKISKEVNVIIVDGHEFIEYGKDYEELCNFFRTKSTGFRHFTIMAFQLEHMGPNINFLTQLNLTVHDKTLENPNILRFCPNLEKLSIMYKGYFYYPHGVADDIEFEQVKNCLKNAPNLKSLELKNSTHLSFKENSSIPLFDLLINHPKIRTLSLQFYAPPGYIMINIKSYSNFEDIRIGVSTPVYCDFAQLLESLKILNIFFKKTANFIINLSLTFSIRPYFIFNFEKELPPLSLLPKCKQLTIDASSEHKFSSHFLLSSSFPALRKIVTKSSPNVLYCSEIISSVKYIEIWNGSEIETNDWAALFPNTTELIIKNPSYYFLSSLMRDKKIKEMKNLKILNLIDVDSSFFPTLSRKYGRGLRLQTLLQSDEGPVKKNQLVELVEVESPYSPREMNVNENNIGPWSTLFSYFLTILTFLEL